MGADVKWDAVEKKVTIKNDDTNLEMCISNVGQEDHTKPQLIDDRVMVPLRYISEQLGAMVIWNGEEKSIAIFK